MIVGLSGAKGSGKDTVAAYLVKEHNFERKAFADPLKQSIAALFNIPFTEVDKLKLNTSVLVGIGNMGEPEYEQWIQYRGIRGMTFRELLQRYGTEAHRDIFGNNFWLDITLPVGGYYPGRAIVVTDCRFRNEAERVRVLGGVNWMIHRKTALDSQEQHSLHSSETFDYDDLIDAHIDNDASMDELFALVESTLYSAQLYEA